MTQQRYGGNHRISVSLWLKKLRFVIWSLSISKEKLDPKNGLIFTPTYDKLFNDGFISFEDDGTILISPWLSPLTIKKLGLIPRKKYDIPAKGRENYLKYHRENIFRK